MQGLKPCPFRQVDGDGNILCDKIKTGDRAVSPNICRACPIAAIQCSHLRATLSRQTHVPVVVHYGNGKTEIWEDSTPPITMERAACAEKVIPIHSPRDCAGCPLRMPLTAPTADDRPVTVDRRPVRRTPPITGPRPPVAAPTPSPAVAVPMAAQPTPVVPSPVAAPAPAIPAPMAAQPAPAISDAEKRRSTIVAQKIIKLQEWLEKQKRAPRDEDSDEVRPIAMAMPRAQTAPRREEKSVGWTD